MGFAGIGFVILGLAVMADLIPVEVGLIIECDGYRAGCGEPFAFHEL